MSEHNVTVGRDMVRPFDGTGDFIAWFTKVELIADINNVTKIASLIPVFLEGDALAIYLEMKKEDRKDLDKIKTRLQEAFADSPVKSFAKLVTLKWSGEQVDVYLNELRKFARLAGYEGKALEQTVRLCFINGLPESVSLGLQQVPGIYTMDLSDILVKARILATNNSGTAAVSIGKPIKPSENRYENNIRRGGNSNQNSKIQCFRCSGPHLIRNCPAPKPPMVCFRCRKEGHIAAHCDQPSQGNEWRGPTAPVATPHQQ